MLRARFPTRDILGRVTLETRVIGAQTYQIGYQWDADGKRAAITYPSGRKVLFDRNVNGDINAVRTQPSGGSIGPLVTSITRTPFGPRSIVEFANGVREERTYDQDGRVVSLDVLQTPATYLMRRSFEYSDKRNLTAINDLLNAANNEDYTYTANGFLLAATGPWLGLSAGQDVYALGSDSNRLTGVSTNGTPSRSLTSDAAGNITEDTDLATSTTKKFAYNHPGQLSSVEVASTAVGVYKYDYLSRLVSRELPASSTTLHLVHDLDGNVIAEYSSAGTLLREYVWLEERPVAVVIPGTPPVTYSVHTDHLERPVMMTDASPASAWQASYLPYGEVASITGPASLDYRFPGQWFQLESGLHYNWHRHYDETTGRYVQPDPLGMPDGPSRWAYAANSPLMNIDPSGRYIPSWLFFDLPSIPKRLREPLFPDYCPVPDTFPSGPPLLNEQSSPDEDEDDYNPDFDDDKIHDDDQLEIPANATKDELLKKKSDLQKSIKQREREQEAWRGESRHRDDGHMNKIRKEREALSKINDRLRRNWGMR